MAGAGYSYFNPAAHYHQQERLGLSVPDKDGDLWGYTKLLTAIPVNRVAATDTRAPSLRAGVSIGANVLGITMTPQTTDVRGAYGRITEGTNSDVFYVIGQSADGISITIDTPLTFAYITAATITLVVFGRANVATDVTIWHEGVATRAYTAEDVGEYAWLKRTGVTKVTEDVSATNTSIGGRVVPQAQGRVKGAVAGDESPKVIGLALGASVDAAGDHAVWVDLDIRAPASKAFAESENSYNQVNIGI